MTAAAEASRPLPDLAASKADLMVTAPGDGTSES